MNTAPSIDDLLEGVIIAITDEIVPHLGNPKAMAAAAMMQAVLQSVRQTLPVYDNYLADEHNGMTRVLRDTAMTLGDASGDEADRIRERAATLGQLPDLPPPGDRQAIADAHRQLGFALVATMRDLDVLQRAGDTRADEALDVLRSHLGPRYLRDAATVLVGEGMVGRG